LRVAVRSRTFRYEAGRSGTRAAGRVLGHLACQGGLRTIADTAKRSYNAGDAVQVSFWPGESRVFKVR
ncbi:MAG: hypothetical protein QGD90_01980, partial [Candidatus Hydrogenedentes bacterium]|nr:hypothetical protein [Candidatus Hydrogenedentota bacterium]